MSRRANEIGFSQRVRLEWLEQTANLVLAGNDRSAVNETLQELLRDKISVGSQAERGNREKIITILTRIWLNTPSELDSLRLGGLEMLRRLPPRDHVTIHWGMAMAVYPFWADVAVQVGRLLRLQGFAAASHVQRRIREQYGERETVARAARRVLRSYVDWGVIGETEVKGVYKAAPTRPIEDHRLISWLVEASLHARSNGAAPLRELIDNPSLFPFHLKPIPTERCLAASESLCTIRHGLDDELVMLRR